MSFPPCISYLSLLTFLWFPQHFYFYFTSLYCRFINVNQTTTVSFKCLIIKQKLRNQYCLVCGQVCWAGSYSQTLNVNTPLLLHVFKWKLFRFPPTLTKSWLQNTVKLNVYKTKSCDALSVFILCCGRCRTLTLDSTVAEDMRLKELQASCKKYR